MTHILAALDAILSERKTQGDVESSYVAQLHKKGLNKILEKVGEEAIETVLAAKDAESSKDTEHVIAETADLWFHSLVMLSHLGVNSEQVLEELARRFNISGLDEKASRQN